MRLFSRLVLLATASQLAACQAAVEFRHIPLQVATIQIQVQLADTVAKRMQGLMYQQNVQHGMLLLYDTPQDMVLWMKNTPTALDVAFINADWRIMKITAMAANSEQLHDSGAPVIAALEMPQGWFAQHGIGTGDAVHSCEALPQSCQSKDSDTLKQLQKHRD